MSCVGFSEKGYEYCDDGKYVLFSSDNTHNYLFDYIGKDLGEVSELFEKYISNRMDTTTFELNECQNSSDEINDIIEKLKLIHPYFEYQYKEDIVNKIGNYFNELLIYAIMSKNKTAKDNATEQEWYLERLTKLIPPSFWNDDIGKDFYNKFLKRIEYVFVDNFLDVKPMVCTNEIRTQKDIYNMLFFILDISAPDIGDLKLHQRIWLYGNIFNRKGRAIESTQSLSFLPPIYFRPGEDRSQEADYSNKMEDLFQSLNVISKLDVGYDNIPTGIKDFSSAIEYAKTITDAKIYTEYKVNSLRELLYLEIISMIQSGTMIRKCKNCGKYFVVNNRKIIYCERKTAFGKPCSVVGPSQSFQKKMNNDEAWKLYRRAYNTHYTRAYRTKGNKNIAQEEFSAWCDEAKKMLEQVWAGELDISDYQDWLKK